MIRAQLCNPEVALIGPLFLGGGLVLDVDWWGRCLHTITPTILDGVTRSAALDAASISLALSLVGQLMKFPVELGGGLPPRKLVGFSADWCGAERLRFCCSGW